jgi:hypothetical protein
MVPRWLSKTRSKAPARAQSGGVYYASEKTWDPARNNGAPSFCSRRLFFMRRTQSPQEDDHVVRQLSRNFNAVQRMTYRGEYG